MKSRRPNAPPRDRFAGAEGLCLALVTLLLLPPVGFAAPKGAGSPPKFDARAAAASPAAIAYVVNTTDDPGSLINCADKAKKCTLRDAIQKANAAAGDDVIEFSIPATDPFCNAGDVGRCTINLSSALPDLTTNIETRGSGADKLTVQRNSGGDYRVFTVSATGTVSFSGVTLSGGNAGTGAGGCRS
jgi:hypothetical protein